MSSNPPVYHFFRPHILLDSKISSQLFLKFHPKFLHTLKFYIPLQITKSPETLSFIKQHFSRISKRIKSLHSLNVTECSLAIIMTKNGMLGMMKSFNRLTNFIMNCYYIDFKFLLAAICWLKIVKGLKYFKSILIADLDYFFMDREPQIEFLLRKRFIKYLQGMKSLETLEVSSPQDILIPSLFKRLRSIKNLALHGPAISPKNLSIHRKAIPSIKYLKSLEIIDTSQILLIPNLLTSILLPESVTCLGFKIQAKNPIHYKSFSRLKWALKPFRSLKKFSLIIEKSPTKMNILEVLQGLPLEELNLSLIVEEEFLTNLGFLIAGFHDMKVLKLRIKSLWKQEDLDGSLATFLRSLKNLSLLQVLNINFSKSIKEDNLIKGDNKAILALTDSLISLENLTELDFECSGMNYTGNLRLVVQALLERAALMRKISFGFEGQDLTGEDLMDIVQIVKEAKGLEEFGLKGLKIDNGKFIDRLVKVILKTERLSILDLKGAIIEVKKNYWMEIVERILGKKGFERYEGNEIVFKDKGKVGKVVDLVEVFRKNRSLKRVEVDKGMRKYFQNLESFIREMWK